ncbi:MAG TPA: polyamine aminopropyltransferase [Candidatus Adamsella sp.]|nr:polyamine aminopropyltransferase [Candidatus Adamsella sp.]
MDLKYTELNELGFGVTMETQNVLYSAKTEYQTIDILETQGLGKVLLLDGLVMTTERDEFFYHEMISHIPMNSHPNPERVLVIGGGDGGTVREVLKHDTVKEVVLCEIDGMVIDACKKYLPSIAGMLDDERVNIQVRDGIDYISQQEDAFDIILIDSTDPMGPGEGLFTEEFYSNVNKALKEGGIMSAQSESPFVNQRQMKMMYPLLRKAFPKVNTFLGPIPTYPGGYWSWAFCSNTVEPLSFIAEDRVQKIAKQAKLYNLDIHKAAFALPNFVKKLVGQDV